MTKKSNNCFDGLVLVDELLPEWIREKAKCEERPQPAAPKPNEAKTDRIA